ncbi:NAD-dependent epimerase/dehydratase family protein [Gorillibacterium sp. sgz5001074]|uniref:NAD-dependent epimerase/dehydratase family protein n=1 Tax=Gorillibacterium sp. sgz5001074 TaxID=3446695 RepID=UPI003F662CE3
MKALVTGGTGFLGERLSRVLTERGWHITATGRNPDIGARLRAHGVDFVQADLRNKERLRTMCQGQDVVFHCGALSSPWGAYQDFYETNVTGTENVVEACLREGVGRLVHVSTPSIYFDYTDRLNIHEDDPLPMKPANPYAATKRLAEEAVRRGMGHGLPSVMIRPRGIFGPGDTSILPRLIAANDTGGVPLIRGGRAMLDMTYIDNVVDGLEQAASAPQSAMGLAYNLSNDEPVRLLDAVQRLFEQLDKPLKLRSLPYPAASLLGGCMEVVSRMTGKEPKLTRSTIGLVSFSQTLDITRAKEKLGYRPAVSMDEGLQRFSDWWKEENI